MTENKPDRKVRENESERFYVDCAIDQPEAFPSNIFCATRIKNIIQCVWNGEKKQDEIYLDQDRKKESVMITSSSYSIICTGMFFFS